MRGAEKRYSVRKHGNDAIIAEARRKVEEAKNLN
jgi:hypothetical protein